MEYCEDIVRREKALIEAGKAEKKKLELRSNYSTLSIKRKRGEMSERIKQGNTNLRFNSPFKMDLSVEEP